MVVAVYGPSDGSTPVVGGEAAAVQLALAQSEVFVVDGGITTAGQPPFRRISVAKVRSRVPSG